MNIRDPRAQKIMLGAILLGGVFYVYFGTSLLPFGYQVKAAEIDTLKAEYARLSTEVSQAKRLAADLPRVEALHRATQKKWETAHELLPARTEMAGLLRQITLVGQSSGVEFVKFEPRNSTSHEYYAANPVEIAVVGSYHQVGAFLSEIATMPRLVNVGMMNMRSLVGGEDDETVTADFIASAYSVTGNHVRATQGVQTPGTPAGRSGAGGRSAPPRTAPPLPHTLKSQE